MSSENHRGLHPVKEEVITGGASYSSTIHCLPSAEYCHTNFGKLPGLDHQIPHSIDPFISASANSDLHYNGHEITVNALGVNSNLRGCHGWP